MDWTIRYENGLPPHDARDVEEAGIKAIEAAIKEGMTGVLVYVLKDDQGLVITKGNVEQTNFVKPIKKHFDRVIAEKRQNN
jgi:hypothetical protein